MRHQLKQFLFFFFCLLISNINAQEKNRATFAKEYWSINAKKHQFVTYKGKKALFLERGAAVLKDATLKNGIIEYDVSFEKGRKFAAIQFRMKDAKNYEQFYVRAHQSGNPDAMQYTPTFNGVSGWQLYHGKGYSNAYHFNFKEWMHVKLVINNDKMDVYINDMSLPILQVHDLKREMIAGKIGFHSLLTGAYYANLSFQELENPRLYSNKNAIPKLEKNVLTNWQVSTVFNQQKLKETTNLKKEKWYKNIKWETVESEYDGKLNLAKSAIKTKANNTVFAKTIIISKKKQIIPLHIGYSDEVKVFVNGKVLYAGHNKFRSRDYRYLGTIGYFDTIYLELKKGSNEIVFAVTENIGGWGLKATLENLNNIVK